MNGSAIHGSVWIALYMPFEVPMWTLSSHRITPIYTSSDSTNAEAANPPKARPFIARSASEDGFDTLSTSSSC